MGDVEEWEDEQDGSWWGRWTGRAGEVTGEGVVVAGGNEAASPAGADLSRD